MVRIYTRSGDGGDTSLGDGSRTPKAAARVEFYGEIDEMNSLLGCCVSILKRPEAPDTGSLADDLAAIQSGLFDLGAILADPVLSAQWAALPEKDQPFDARPLEQMIDAFDPLLEPLRNFILPGGTEAAAMLHVARAACRRAERRAVALAGIEAVPSGAITYLNRLSDFLFTAARGANAAAGVRDVPWVAQPKDG
jgi:cob(I)alamin adenosyltransferase